MDRQQLLTHLQKSDFKQLFEALHQLRPNLNQSLQEQVIQLASRYNSYLREMHLGVAAKEDLNIELNQLRNAVMYTIDQIPDGAFPVADASTTTDTLFPVGSTSTTATPAAPATPSNHPTTGGGHSLWLGAAALIAVVGLFVVLVIFQDQLKGSTGALGEIFFIVLLGILAAVAYFQLMPSQAEGSGKFFGMDLKLRGPIIVGVLVAVGSFLFLQARGDGGEPFDFTVRIIPPELPEYPPLEDGSLKIWVVNRYEKPELNSDLLAEVKGIPASEEGQRSDARLEGARFWKLEVDSVTLTRAGQTLRAVPDGSLGAVSGRVTNSANGEPLEGVQIEVAGAPTDTTDQYGKFYIYIPIQQQRTEYQLTATKSYYAPVSQTVYPNSTVKISLKSKRRD